MTSMSNGPDRAAGEFRWGGRARPRRATIGEEGAARVVSRALSEWSRWPDCPDGLRVGVVCDTSEPMRAAAGSLPSLAWVLSTAARIAAWPPSWERPGTVCAATMLAGERVGPPGVGWADDVRPIQAFPIGGPSRIDEGIHAVTSAASLTASTQAARLLVVITDAQGETDVLDRTRGRIEALQVEGCAALWLCPAIGPCELDAFTGLPVHVFDPTRHLVANVLGCAVLDALYQAVPGRREPYPEHEMF